MMHHALQCREPGWSTIFDWDAKEAAASRRKFLSEVADTSTLILPIHFPSPTVGRVTAGRRALPLLIRAVRRAKCAPITMTTCICEARIPDATARFFETMFNAEVTRSVYPPGTLYPGQMRVTMTCGWTEGADRANASARPDGERAAVPILRARTHRSDGRRRRRCMRRTARQGRRCRDRSAHARSGTRLAFVRGPEGIMVELVQSR